MIVEPITVWAAFGTFVLGTLVGVLIVLDEVTPPVAIDLEPVIAADFSLVDECLHFLFCQNFFLTVKIGRFQLQPHAAPRLQANRSTQPAKRRHHGSGHAGAAG